VPGYKDRSLNRTKNMIFLELSLNPTWLASYRKSCTYS